VEVVAVALDTSPKVATLTFVDSLVAPFLTEHPTLEHFEDNHKHLLELEDQVTFKDYTVVASAQTNQDSTEASTQIILMVEDRRHLHQLPTDAPEHFLTSVEDLAGTLMVNLQKFTKDHLDRKEQNHSRIIDFRITKLIITQREYSLTVSYFVIFDYLLEFEKGQFSMFLRNACNRLP
tara:strand:- start:419 stop:952 length:534 start_codon:yes stop_codon:yes gene_type:complete